MIRSLLTLALLALSLPAPAMSTPLPDHPLAAPRWWIAGDADGYDELDDANQPWWRQLPNRPVDGYGPLPPGGWRARHAYRLPDYGYRHSDQPTPGPGVYRPGRRLPLAVLPPRAQPERRCGPGAALVGAAIGGGLGAALSDGSRQRQWALPIGATVGGLLGGVLAGC